MAALAILAILELRVCYWMVSSEGLLTLNTTHHFRYSIIATVLFGKVMVPY